MRYANTERLMELVVALQATRIGLSLADIQERFRVAERTAQRMRDAVLRLHPNTEELIDTERRKRWRIPAGSARIDVNADEIADLEAAASLLWRDNQRARSKRIRALATKLRAGLPADAQRRVEPDLEALLESEGLAMRPGPRPVIRSEILDSLRGAIKQCRQVFITYRYRRQDRKTGRKLHPYGFLFGSRGYLVARCPGKQPEIRMFALSNIESVRIAEEPFSRDPGFSLKVFAERSFGIFQEDPVDVVWRFTPEAAASARDYMFHPTQSMEEQADGSLIVRFTAGGLQEMAWHVVTWNGHLEVLAPESLRAML
jgi:predicted DNA-binding transcriptional regulator YafY